MDQLQNLNEFFLSSKSAIFTKGGGVVVQACFRYSTSISTSYKILIIVIIAIK